MSYLVSNYLCDAAIYLNICDLHRLISVNQYIHSYINKFIIPIYIEYKLLQLPYELKIYKLICIKYNVDVQLSHSLTKILQKVTTFELQSYILHNISYLYQNINTVTISSHVSVINLVMNVLNNNINSLYLSLLLSHIYLMSYMLSKSTSTHLFNILSMMPSTLKEYIITPQRQIDLISNKQYKCYLFFVALLTNLLSDVFIATNINIMIDIVEKEYQFIASQLYHIVPDQFIHTMNKVIKYIAIVSCTYDTNIHSRHSNMIWFSELVT